MAKFSLLTVLLLYLGMLYFGREAGLPDKRIGRETSLWAELFGGGGDAGPLALLTQPAGAPAPEPAPEPAQDLAPEPASEPASDIIAEPQEPADALAVADAATVPAPGAEPSAAPDAVPSAVPDAAPSAVPGTENEPEPEAERIAGSDRAPARSLRPLARPERPVALAEAGAASTDTGSTDTGSTDTGSTDTGQTVAEPDPLEGALEQVLEDVLAEDNTPPVEGVLDTVEPESVAAEARNAPSEPETDAVVATTFAPETTPRPLAKPEPPAVPVVDVPVAAVEPDTAPLAEIAPASEALEEAPTSEVAALAAAALEELPIADPDAVILPEPVAEPAPEAAPAPETVETVAAVPEAAPAAEPVAEEAAAAPEDVPALNETDATPGATPEAIAATEAETAPARELPSNLRPQPRPLQALAPVPAEELSQPASEVLAAPEPESLPEILPETETETETETGAEDGAEIVAAPLREPEPEPEPVVPLFPDEPQGVLYVSSAGVTVHAGPSADDRAIDEMPRGSAVVDLGGDGDGWRMILLPNGAAGYIPDTEVSLTPDQ